MMIRLGVIASPARAKQSKIATAGSAGLAMTIFLFTFCHFSFVFAGDFRYDAKGKRDPFLSPAQAALLKKQLGPGELRLEGIIIDDKAASYAVVNREVVKAGDSFSGFTLKKIEPNTATFVKDGEEFTLFLHEDELKPANQKDHPLTQKKE